jgi:iron-sulfur cluster assembly protein
MEMTSLPMAQDANAPRAEDEVEAPMLTLTERAVEMVKQALVAENLPGHSLRVAVVGGGCSGYQYGLDFDEAASDEDIVLAQGDVKILIDQYSATYLKGTTIDYVDSLNGSGFKFNNPVAKKTCGCGSSFSA